MMKTIFLLFLGACFTQVIAQKSFEGIITMTPDFKTKPRTDEIMKIYVKGDKVAMEMPAKDGKSMGRLVGNSTTREYYMLTEMGEKKVAVKMNFDQMMMQPGMDPAMQHPDQHAAQPDVKI